jgi:hypothetical protein
MGALGLRQSRAGERAVWALGRLADARGSDRCDTLGAGATHYEEEIRVKIRRLTTALEPALTLVVSLLVMGVALAIFLPMWESNTMLLKH